MDRIIASVIRNAWCAIKTKVNNIWINKFLVPSKKDEIVASEVLPLSDSSLFAKSVIKGSIRVKKVKPSHIPVDPGSIIKLNVIIRYIAGETRLRLILSNIFHLDIALIGFMTFSPLKLRTRGNSHGSNCQSPRTHR